MEAIKQLELINLKLKALPDVFLSVRERVQTKHVTPEVNVRVPLFRLEVGSTKVFEISLNFRKRALPTR